MSDERCCAVCGHTAADHVEGFIGAAANDIPLCHVDDHSCYHAVTCSGAVTVDGWLAQIKRLRAPVGVVLGTEEKDGNT